MRTAIRMRFNERTTMGDMRGGMRRVLKTARIRPKSIEITKIVRSGAQKYVDFLIKY